MFKNYLEYKKPKTNFFVYHNLRKLFQKIESFLFIFLCLVLIVISKTNHSLVDNLSIKISRIILPISHVISLPVNVIVDTLINLEDLINAREKNKALIQENEKLRLLYIKSLAINQENLMLKRVLKYTSLKSSQYLLTRLSARPNQIYGNNIFIDAGLDDGITEGNIVTGSKSIIGRIIQADSKKARVLLLTDINSRIPVIISGAKVKGILAGNNSEKMNILYLDKKHHITIGDLVFTSGDGDYLPPGLLVGIITKVEKDNVEVTMAENVKNIDIVGVMQY